MKIKPVKAWAVYDKAELYFSWVGIPSIYPKRYSAIVEAVRLTNIGKGKYIVKPVLITPITKKRRG